MIIDIHAHVYRKPAPFVVKFCTPDELLRRFDAAGVDQGFLLPIVNSEIYLPHRLLFGTDSASRPCPRCVRWRLSSATCAPRAKSAKAFSTKSSVKTPSAN